MARWHIKNISVSLSLTVLGFQAELSAIPFRWARPAYRNPRDNTFMHDKWGYQVYCGPFHFWTMSGLSETLGIALRVTQDPFHGGELLPRVKS